MNKVVNLAKRVKTPNGLRFCTAERLPNGRVKPNVVKIAGKEEFHPEGSYYLEWYDGKRRRRISVGKSAAIADGKRQQKQQQLELKAAGLKAGLTFTKEDPGRVTLEGARTAYLAEILLTKKPKTVAAYTTALDYFTASCSKQHVAEVDRLDLLKFSAFLRDEKEQAPRSVYNKFENVMTFLKANGIRGIVGKNDWPRYTEEEPQMYEPEELEKLFKACDSDELMWYEFFLMTGMREQEVMHTYRSDVNCAGCVVRVTHKPDRGWTPKAYKEREIPISAKLAERLKTWMAKADKKCNLLFPTAGCNPKLDFLDCLKAVAERAELDKGEFWLHKFRSTFATRLLRVGVDLRTVQSYMGHVDIESTMRYLKPSRNPEVLVKMNEAFA